MPSDLLVNKVHYIEGNPTLAYFIFSVLIIRAFRFFVEVNFKCDYYEGCESDVGNMGKLVIDF